MIVYVSQFGGRPPPQQSGGFSLTRWIGALVLGLFGLLMVMAVAIAAMAATLIGVIVGMAMLVLRLIPRRKVRQAPADGPLELEGRRTPDGWVAEATPRTY